MKDSKTLIGVEGIKENSWVFSLFGIIMTSLCIFKWGVDSNPPDEVINFFKEPLSLGVFFNFSIAGLLLSTAYASPLRIPVSNRILNISDYGF